jgi:ribosome biogenesis GTPase
VEADVTLRLEQFGWDAGWAEVAGVPPERVGRVAAEHRGGWTVMTLAGPVTALLRGKALAETESDRAARPAVGDWVVLGAGDTAGGPSLIERTLPRRTQIARRAIGRAMREQVVAANVDAVFIVSSLGRDLNERRIERFAAIAFEGGVTPVVILNKADLFDAEAQEQARRRISEVAVGTEVHLVSALVGTGAEGLERHLGPGRTVAFVGTSGVGKSTLINRWLHPERQQRTSEIGVEGKGRHTTTSRQLQPLPSGGCVIDTPGLREVGLGAGDEGIEKAFNDVTELAHGCRFSDCRHLEEPGCAVRTAVERGELPEDRLAAFQRLQRERAFVEAKQPRGSRDRQKIQTRAMRKRDRDKKR